MLNKNMIKEFISNNYIKIFIAFLLVLAVLITSIFTAKEDEVKHNKVLIDETRINQYLSYNYESVYSDFSLLLNSTDKSGISYTSNNTKFNSANFYSNDAYYYYFNINSFNNDDITLCLYKEINIDDYYFSFLISDKVEISEFDYTKVNNNLIYSSHINGFDTVFTFIKRMNKNLLIHFEVTVCQDSFSNKGYDDFVNEIILALNDFTKNNGSPYLRDKICFIDLSGYSLKRYDFIKVIKDDKIYIFNGKYSQSHCLNINTLYGQNEFYSFYVNENSKNQIKGLENVYYESNNKSLVFTDKNSFARFNCNITNKNKSKEIVYKYFEKRGV